MTHGDKTKAKGKTSLQASGKKSSSKAGDNGKGAGKAAGGSKAGKAGGSGETSVKKGSPVEKAAAAKAGGAKDGSTSSSPGGDTKTKGRAPAVEAAGFSNPVIADAFKRALKKYPNAFRKLTD
jgi:hypothetical protein